VCGGAGGIGAACADWFGAHDASVILIDRDEAALAEVAGRTGAAALAADLTDPAAVAAAFASVGAEHGRVAVLVNAAGAAGHGAFGEVDVAQWREVLDLNLSSAFLAAQAAAPALLAGGWGKIVNLSSVNARTGGNDLSGVAYAVAKAGVEALTRHLARALAPTVQVNAVAPGPVRTPMLARLRSEQIDELVRSIPAGRIAEPAEIAATIGFLASRDADYVTGVVVDQNGGGWIG